MLLHNERAQRLEYGRAVLYASAMWPHPHGPGKARCPWCGMWDAVPHPSDAAWITTLHDAIKLHKPVEATEPVALSSMPLASFGKLEQRGQ